MYAWGKNELRPISKRAHTGSIFGAYDIGATIIDGLDTLYIMGLKQEYQEGRDWVEQKFTFKNLVNILQKIQFEKFYHLNVNISTSISMHKYRLHAFYSNFRVPNYLYLKQIFVLWAVY